jgi:hypothetical protein
VLPVGGEFQVNSYTSYAQGAFFSSGASVASDAAGNFVVVWQSLYQDGSGDGVFGQRYDSTGNTLGTEFQVNTFTTDHQEYPAVSAGADGSFVVVWESRKQAGWRGIFAQRYDSAGSAAGTEFEVNPSVNDTKTKPAVAMSADGDIVVVWQEGARCGNGICDGSETACSCPVDCGSCGTCAHDACTTGGPLASGCDPCVTSVCTTSPSCCSVAWTGSCRLAASNTCAPCSSPRDVHGQRYDSTGSAQGLEFQVNTYTTDDQDYPAVASDSAGNLVVVWRSFDDQDGDGAGIFGQRYDDAGNALGTEFQVNTYTTGEQGNLGALAVAADSDGDFVVVWSSRTDKDEYGYYAGGYGIAGQRFSNTGSPLGTEFRVNTYTPGDQYAPAVASDAAGNFVVVWHHVSNQDGDSYGVFGQHFDSAGVPMGSEFQVNTQTTDAQRAPAIAFSAADDFVVVWQSYGQDGDDEGVFGQRFTQVTSTTTTTTTTTSTTTLPSTGKCSSSKLKVAGKHAAARGKCVAKAIGKGVVVDPACTGKADGKVGPAFAKAEAKGDCLAPGGDAGAIFAKDAVFVDDVHQTVNAGVVTPASKCDSKKVQAATKKAADKAGCHAKAIGKAISVEPACLAKAEGKFSAATSKAEAGTDCTSAGQAAALEAIVDAFVTDLVGELTSGP